MRHRHFPAESPAATFPSLVEHEGRSLDCRRSATSTLNLEDVTMRNSMIIASALAAAIALPTLAKAGPAPVPAGASDKWYGIAKAATDACHNDTRCRPDTARND